LEVADVRLARPPHLWQFADQIPLNRRHRLGNVNHPTLDSRNWRRFWRPKADVWPSRRPWSRPALKAADWGRKVPVREKMAPLNQRLKTTGKMPQNPGFTGISSIVTNYLTWFGPDAKTERVFWPRPRSHPKSHDLDSQLENSR